jgi:AcrR family transcriptional regulator
VAKALGMTKPALYRYFPNKDALLSAMNSYFLSLFDDVCDRTYRSDGNGRFEDAFNAYNEVFFRFFVENPEYFAYAMVMYIPQARLGEGGSDHIEQKYGELFPDVLLQGELGWGGESIATVRNYIVTVGGFLLSHMAMFGSRDTSLGPEELLELNRKIVLDGFGKGERFEMPDYEMVERACSIGSEDLLAPDHIFSAIAEVVGEYGLWDASLDKIARRAGMTKSSLYFYFENRNDMLWKMIDRERHHVGELFLRRSGLLVRAEEKLYGYFRIFGGYMNLRPDFLAVMNWFRVQRINFKPPNHAQIGMERYLDFMRACVSGEKIRTHGMTEMELVRFLHFMIINEINKGYWSGLSKEEMRVRFRVLFELFVYGAEGE